MMWGIHLLILAVLAWGGYRLAAGSAIRSFYWPALGARWLAGIGVGLLYLYHYQGGDTWLLYDQAVRLAREAFSSAAGFRAVYWEGDYSQVDGFAYTWQPRAAFMAKLLAPLLWLTGGSYWLVSLYLSAFAFAGMWLLAHTVAGRLRPAWLAAVPLFEPTLLFWTSGVLKESLAVGALAALAAAGLRLYRGQQLPRGVWPALLLLWGLLAGLKYYYAGLLAVLAATVFPVRWLLQGSRSRLAEAGLTAGVFFLWLGVGSLLHINFWPSRLPAVMVHNYYQAVLQSGWDKVVPFTGLEPRLLSFVQHTPRALLAGLFFPLSGHNLLSWLAAAGNWLTLALTGAGLVRSRLRLPQSRDSRILLWGVLLFVTVAAVMIAFTAPNYGTLVRLRTGYYLLFWYLLTGLYGRVSGG